MTHIVRNAVDHGIEEPEVRIAAGKPAEGVVSVRAYHEGGQVTIEMSDDGAGIELEAVRAKAVELASMTPEQAARMSERDVVDLLFVPGFSTADHVTNVSGRGVGMDVVRTNIERIGGSIDVSSRSGEGTTFKIRIPLTLAIIPVLIATAADERYAIPQANLLELVGIVPGSIETLHDVPVFRLRDRLLAGRLPGARTPPATMAWRSHPRDASSSCFKQTTAGSGSWSTDSATRPRSW